MIKLDINDLNAIRNALDDVIGYLADNSCGDEECCGGPYYEREHYNEGLEIIERYGLTTTGDARP